MLRESLKIGNAEITGAQSEYTQSMGDEPIDVLAAQLALGIDPENRNTTPILEAHGCEAEDLVLDEDTFLAVFNLDGEEPDGLTVAQRLMSAQKDTSLLSIAREVRESNAIERIRMLNELMAGAMYLAAENDLGEIGELVLQRLAALLDKQFTREEEVCPMAYSYLEAYAAIRPDYLSEATAELFRRNAKSPRDALRELGVPLDELSPRGEIEIREFAGGQQLAVVTGDIPLDDIAAIAQDLDI